MDKLSFIDTHTHLYDTLFDEDRKEVIQSAVTAGVQRMYLPNCNSITIQPMLDMVRQWPEHCFPMIGLHPCYVKDDYKKELALMEDWLHKEQFVAIGETGLDYYWEKTHIDQQKEAFSLQMDWALQLNLPIVIHTRNSMTDSIELVRQKQNGNLKGIFHCFGGTAAEAQQITALGFHIGIGGIATFKNSTLPEVLQTVALENIVLETDAPYLAPVPYRGKRNESAYIPLIAERLATIKQCSVEDIASITYQNALKLFK